MDLMEKLIENVKKHPILYDLSHEDYKNIRRKDEIWREIGNLLDEDGDHLKRKWKNLKDSYAKYLKSSKINETNPKRNYKNWSRASQMESFRPYLTKSTSNTKETGEVDDSMEFVDFGTSNLKTENLEIIDYDESVTIEQPVATNEIITPDTNLNLFQNKETIKQHNIIDEEDSSSSVTKIINYMPNKQQCTRDLDPIDLIFRGYAETVKQFSPRRQARTKLKIAQLIAEQEIEHYEELTIYSQQNNTLPDS